MVCWKTQKAPVTESKLPSIEFQITLHICWENIDDRRPLADSSIPAYPGIHKTHYQNLVHKLLSHWLAPFLNHQFCAKHIHVRRLARNSEENPGPWGLLFREHVMLRTDVISIPISIAGDWVHINLHVYYTQILNTCR